MATAAVRTRSLSRSGAAAAVAVGTVSVAAGWTWGVLLIGFFLSSSALSRVGAAAKERRTAGVVEKTGPRDAAQVLANGGIFAGAALLYLVSEWAGWLSVGAGALAAATADTWATEVGTLSARGPRLITSWRPVPPGTSGAVSAAGLAASVAGAGFIGAAALMLGWPGATAAGAAVGGVAGAAADSLVGALWQARRYCPRCRAATERRVHPCGAGTRHIGGVRWLGNDGVNLLGGAAGAVVALIVSH